MVYPAKIRPLVSSMCRSPRRILDHWFRGHLTTWRRYRDASGSHLIARSVNWVGDIESARRPHRVGQFNAGTVAEPETAVGNAAR